MTKNFIRFCAVSAFTVLLSTTAMATTAIAAGEDHNLTLQEAMSKGVETNPQYGLVADDSLATKEELSQAKALYMPSIDFLGEAGSENTDSPSINDRTLFKRRASLSLTQLLFDGFGTTSEINRQKHRVESTENRVAEVAEFVGLDIVEAYLEVMRQRDLLTISRANVDDHLKILETIKTGASAGTVTEGDVAQVEARTAQARATVSSTEELLRRAEALFIQKVGDVPGTMAFPDVPRAKLPATVEDAVREALVKSPTLAVYESDVKVSQSEYEGSGSTLYPKLQLQANVATGKNLSGVKGTSDGRSILGVMNWNLYRGGADLARQREFMYRHATSKERRAEAARTVEKDMRDTWAGMTASAERAKQFQTQAEANEKVVNVYLNQFTLDRRTLLDVLDSQNELFVSRSSNVNSLYTEMFAVYRVLALKGELLDVVGVARPREAAFAVKK